MKWLPLAAAVWYRGSDGVADRGIPWGKDAPADCPECCFDAKDPSCFPEDSVAIRVDWASPDAPEVVLELFADEACTDLLLSLPVSPARSNETVRAFSVAFARTQ